MADTMTIQELETKLTLNRRELERGFQEMERRSLAFVSNVNRNLGRVGSGVRGSGGGGGSDSGGGFLSGIGEGLKMLPGLGMVAGGLGKVVGVMQSGVKMGFDYRRMIEENTISFEVLLKSGGAARAMLADLGKFAESSPFEMPELLQASKQMLAMGFSAKELVSVLRVTSDASAGLGANMDNIVRALGQMQTKGKASAEEISGQLAEQGVPAWRYLADAIGKVDQSFEKLSDEQRIARVQKLVESGRVSGRGAVEAILIGMQKDFGGLGARFATETATGLEANFKDVLSRQLGTASQSLFEGYKDTLRTGLNILGSDTVTSAAEGVNRKTGELYDAGVNAAKQLEKGWRDQAQQHSPSEVFKELGRGAGASLAAGFQQGLQGLRGVQFDEEIDRLIEENARRTGIDPNLLRAVIRQESGGRRRAVSSAGARGVMQLMPGTAQRFGVTDSFDPAQNIRGGSDYLRQLLDMFGGRVDLALAGYNWGENRRTLRTAHESGRPVTDFRIPEETRNYVTSIMGAYGRQQHGDPHFRSLSAEARAFQLSGRSGGSGPPVPIASAHGPARVYVTNADEIAGLRGRASAEHGGGFELPSFDRLREMLSGARGPISTSATISNEGIAFRDLQAMPGGFNQAAQAAAGLNVEIEQTTDILLPKARKEADFLGITMSGAADGFKYAFSDAFGNIDQGFKATAQSFVVSFAQSLQQMLAEAASARLSEAIFGTPKEGGGTAGGFLRFLGGALKGLFSGGLGGFGGAGAGGSWALGGRPPVGKVSLVGERGPELFMPDRPGYVINNDDVARMVSGVEGLRHARPQAAAAPSVSKRVTYSPNISVNVDGGRRMGGGGYTQRMGRQELGEHIARAILNGDQRSFQKVLRQMDL